MPIPKFDELFNPLLEAIKKLGGSASITELDEEATKSLHLTDEGIAKPHNERITSLQYRLAWSRSYLKVYGLLDNSDRGVWVLTAKGKNVDIIDPVQIKRFVRGQGKRGKTNTAAKKSDSIVNEKIAEAEAVLEETWREELLSKLL